MKIRRDITNKGKQHTPKTETLGKEKQLKNDINIPTFMSL